LIEDFDGLSGSHVVERHDGGQRAGRVGGGERGAVVAPAVRLGDRLVTVAAWCCEEERMPAG
jgi:hypothetical protein